MSWPRPIDWAKQRLTVAKETRRIPCQSEIGAAKGYDIFLNKEDNCEKVVLRAA